MTECKDYGKRMEDWDKCKGCKDILACSLLTLELVLGEKDQHIEVITPHGKVVTISICDADREVLSKEIDK